MYIHHHHPNLPPALCQRDAGAGFLRHLAKTASQAILRQAAPPEWEEANFHKQKSHYKKRVIMGKSYC